MQQKLLLWSLFLLTPLISKSETNAQDYTAFIVGTIVGSTLGTVTIKTVAPYLATFNPFTQKNKEKTINPINELELAFKNCYQTTFYAPHSINYTFDHVIGHSDAKKILHSTWQQLNSSITLGNTLSATIFLIGPSGIGKTSLVKAFTGLTGYLCIKTTCDNLTQAMSNNRISHFVQKLKNCAPCILYIDDIQFISNTTGNILNELIDEIKYAQNKERPIFLIGSGDHTGITSCDSFNTEKIDHIIELRNPHINDRIALVTMYLQNIKYDPTIDNKKVAEQLQGATGFEIQKIINNAAQLALQKSKTIVETQDIYEAIRAATAGQETHAYLCSKQEKLETAYHEAGHALGALLLPNTWLTFNLISTESRHKALGLIEQIRIDKHFTKEDAFSFIAMCLGGRAAEELIFNKIATGPSTDLKMATEMARTMICEYGMTDVIGKQVFNRMLCSQKTLEKIDEAITEILEEQYQRIKQLLIDNRDKLDLLAHTVFEKEILYADEVYELLSIEPKKYNMLL